MSTTNYELPELWMELKDASLLASLMEEQGKSVRHIARIANYKSHTHVRRMLAGESRNLDSERAARIAHDLGVPFGLLFRTRLSGDRARNDVNGHAA